MATTQQTLTDVEPSLVDQYVTEDGSTIETREANDETVEEQCPTCGNWYRQIGGHWAKSSCSHPPISQYQWEMCKGLMMGDATFGVKNTKNCNFEIGNTNLSFLKYLDDEFGWLVSTLYQQKTAQKSANQMHGREIGGEVIDANEVKYLDTYILILRCHPLFNHFEQWWKTGEKVFPQLNYSKPLLRMWWVSDGSLTWYQSGSSHVSFASCNEGTRPQNIIQSFNNIGFDCSLYGDNKFALPVTQTEDFFDYIGHDPVPGFEYKWAYEDRDRYERLMKERKEKHCTQTIK